MKTVLISAALVSAALAAGATDPLTEARHRAKYGRSTPAAEAQQSPATDAACSRAHQKAAVEPRPADAEERLKAKLGRYSAVEEQRVAQQGGETAACSGSGCCARANAKVARTETDERLRAKTGRYSPAERADPQPVLVASAHAACNAPCCKTNQ